MQSVLGGTTGNSRPQQQRKRAKMKDAGIKESCWKVGLGITQSDRYYIKL